MVAPQPAHHVGEDGAAVLLAVPADAPLIVEVVALVAQRLHQPHVLEEPVALLVVVAVPADAAVVVAAVLQKIRIGFFSVFRTMSAYAWPPRRLVKLPIMLSTLRNSLGRSHATVKAAIAPELAPPMPRRSGSFAML